MNNLEGVILIRNKEGEVIGFVLNMTGIGRHPVLYKAEPMNFQDLEEYFKSK